jgi:hypothetical protein
VKRILYIFLLIGLLAGCAAIPVRQNPQPHCVVNSILCAWTWGTFQKDEVRIAVSSIAPGLDHAQAEAKIRGVWTPLTERWAGDHLEIVPWRRHFDKEPYRYVTLKEWISEQIQFANQH